MFGLFLCLGIDSGWNSNFLGSFSVKKPLLKGKKTPDPNISGVLRYSFSDAGSAQSRRTRRSLLTRWCR